MKYSYDISSVIKGTMMQLDIPRKTFQEPHNNIFTKESTRTFVPSASNTTKAV